MAIFKFSLLAVIFLAAHVSADPTIPTAISLADTYGLSSSLTSTLIEWASTLVEYLFQLFDLKMRSVRFLVSLYNNENLHLFKRYMDIILRVVQWLHDIIPETTTDASLRFLSYLFPQQNQPEHKLEEENLNKEHSTMPSLIHSLGIDERAAARENLEVNKINVVDPFADQVLSLEHLINARNGYDRRRK